MTRYDLAYCALAPLVAPILLYRRLALGKYRESFPSMFGKNWSKPQDPKWDDGCLWVHAVSVGECVAAKALIRPLRDHVSALPVLLTTVTETGQALARQLVPEHADLATYYPADFSWIVKKFLSTFMPRLLVLMETELWPNVIEAAAANNMCVVVANGRISEDSFRQYLRFRSLFHRPLKKIDAFCMQSEEDAERIIQIGAPKDRVHVTGNCKFDVPYACPSESRKEELRQLLGIEPGMPVVVFGSTHPGEEEIVVRVTENLRSRIPSLKVLLVPRHPERFEAVWKFLEESQIPAGRLSRSSEAPLGKDLAIVLIDKMGLLAELYALATVAVVAGSFVPGIGGHNLLEAAIHGIPVVYGPYMEKQPELTRILSPQNGGIVADRSTLSATLHELLTNPERQRKHGDAVRHAAISQQGAALKTAEIIGDAFRRKSLSAKYEPR